METWGDCSTKLSNILTAGSVCCRFHLLSHPDFSGITTVASFCAGVGYVTVRGLPAE